MTTPELALPADPLERYAAVLRLLAEQCAALADRVEADGYPYWPEAAVQLARQSRRAALVRLATVERESNRWVLLERGDGSDQAYVAYDRAGELGDMAQRSEAVASRMVRRRNRELPWPTSAPPTGEAEHG